MGVPIDREAFDEADHREFAERLRRQLATLADVLGRPGFGIGPPTLGAELELFLVDQGGRPVCCNAEVVRRAGHPAITLEADRFDLECITTPVDLRGRPFAALREELAKTTTVVRAAAAAYGARPLAIGILPTLVASDLRPEVLSDGARYRALSAALRRLRGEPFAMHIRGEEELEVSCEDVTFEGATASWQVHLRVPPAAFARTYNAALVAIAPALAAAVNSPLFLGRRLWHETRVALFRQAVDERPGGDETVWRPARVSFGHGWVREGAYELFARAVAMHAPVLPALAPEEPESQPATAPALAELRLHQGTVWHWTRPVYDPAAGGHLRIEMRALPSGPTLDDMLGNTAFLVGLTLALAPRMDELLHRLTFGQARWSFYQAARHGLDAELLWPSEEPPSPRPARGADLVARLLPLARQGLVAAGVEAHEADTWLAIVAARLPHGRTGARWQLDTLAALEGGGDEGTRPAALVTMLGRYARLADAGTPVAAWPSGAG